MAFPSASPQGILTSALLLLLSFQCSLTFAQSNATSAAANASWPYKTFKTANFTPPELIVKKTGPLTDGYLFMTVFGAMPTEKSPLIMTDDNDLIWNGPLNLTTSVFSVQTYQNEPVLAYWTGALFPEPLGRGYGVVHFFNKSYDEVATVSLDGAPFFAQNGQKFPSAIDLHELYVTENNTLLVTANNITQTDLRSVGGPEDGWVADALIYEIDIATNQVLFKWSALEHVDQIPLNLSVYPVGAEGYTGTNQSSAWGYFHINAVSPLPGGGYIISSRYLCSAIAIDKQGDVQWILHGRYGVDFTLGPSTNFCFQHDIRAFYTDPNARDPTKLTVQMHNNFNAPIENGTNPTTGLELLLDLSPTPHTTTLSRRLLNPASPVFATAQGDYQPLADQHVLMGYGYVPQVAEFNSSGAEVMRFAYGPAPGQTVGYRTYRQPWVGCPRTKPSVAVVAGENGGTGVYMSWNGATEYDTWYVYGAMQSGGNLTLISTVPRRGFETRAAVQKTWQVVQAEAVTSEAKYASSQAGNGTGGTGCDVSSMKSDIVSVM